MQACNLQNLPENYTMRYCIRLVLFHVTRVPDVLADLYHAMTWPSLSYVAEDAKGRIVGYVLAKMCVPHYDLPLSNLTGMYQGRGYCSWRRATWTPDIDLGATTISETWAGQEAHATVS